MIRGFIGAVQLDLRAGPFWAVTGPQAVPTIIPASLSSSGFDLAGSVSSKLLFPNPTARGCQ